MPNCGNHAYCSANCIALAPARKPNGSTSDNANSTSTMKSATYLMARSLERGRNASPSAPSKGAAMRKESMVIRDGSTAQGNLIEGSSLRICSFYQKRRNQDDNSDQHGQRVGASISGLSALRPACDPT